MMVMSGAAVLEIVELVVTEDLELEDGPLEDGLEVRVDEELPDPERVLVDNVVEAGVELRVWLLLEPLKEPLEELLV